MGGKALILGIGNVLWADEGFGVRCVEEMARTLAYGPEVQILDGGTQGLYLLPFLEEANMMVVFDAVDYGLEPGTMKIVEGDDVPAFMGAKKMSLHQTGFQDVIATAQLMGHCPEEIMLVGVQPVELEDYGGGLRDKTAAQIAPVIQVARDWLAARGIHATEGQTPTNDLADVSLMRENYEGNRPSEEDACRTGDDRFFPTEVA
ncbi:HyaD/HybD family hydrogenase maturation endopeptidase [Pseudooceanicola sp. MF1-13]|uniref:HyaD/HybD family hydrogenase maturation endopeptidase n=1 Tax=Pseudooceanicola sp. MF1-13 TaxID=3379095 RepID=UPI003891AA1F